MYRSQTDGEILDGITYCQMRHDIPRQ